MHTKLISAITTVCFIVSSAFSNAGAAAALPAQTGEVLPFTSTFGKAVINNNALSGPLIINIQDLHADASINGNIYNLINELSQKYNITKIFAEGGFGEVDLSLINSIKDEKLRNKITARLFSRGVITAGEYYALKSGISLYGLEDNALHKENLRRLAAILSKKTYYGKILDSVSREIDYLKLKHLSHESRRFDALVENYKNSKIDAKKYYAFLLKFIAKNNAYPDLYGGKTITLSAYPSLKNYMDYLRLLKTIDVRSLPKEIFYIKNALKNIASYNDYQQIVRIQNPEALILALNSLCVKYGIPVKKNSNFCAYISMIKTLDKVNSAELVADERAITQAVRALLAFNQAELETAYLSDFYYYVKSFFETSLTKPEYEYFIKNYDRFISIYSSYAYENVFEQMSDEIASVKEYYRVNIQRDNIFAKNVMSEVNKSASEAYIVITGGFHSQALGDIFKSKNLSYISFIPEVSSAYANAKEKYEKAVTGKYGSQTLALTLAMQSVDGVFFKEMLSAAGRNLEGIKYDKANIEELAARVGEILGAETGFEYYDDRSEINFAGNTVTLFNDENKISFSASIPVNTASKNKAVYLLSAFYDTISNVFGMSETAYFEIFKPDTYEYVKNIMNYAARNNLAIGDGLIFDIAADDSLGENIGGLEKQMLAKCPEFFQKAAIVRQRRVEELGKHQSDAEWLKALQTGFILYGLGFGVNKPAKKTVRQIFKTSSNVSAGEYYKTPSNLNLTQAQKNIIYAAYLLITNGNYEVTEKKDKLLDSATQQKFASLMAGKIDAPELTDEMLMLFVLDFNLRHKYDAYNLNHTSMYKTYIKNYVGAGSLMTEEELKEFEKYVHTDIMGYAVSKMPEEIKELSKKLYFISTSYTDYERYLFKDESYNQDKDYQSAASFEYITGNTAAIINMAANAEKAPYGELLKYQSIALLNKTLPQLEFHYNQSKEHIEKTVKALAEILKSDFALTDKVCDAINKYIDDLLASGDYGYLVPELAEIFRKNLIYMNKGILRAESMEEYENSVRIKEKIVLGFVKEAPGFLKDAITSKYTGKEMKYKYGIEIAQLAFNAFDGVEYDDFYISVLDAVDFYDKDTKTEILNAVQENPLKLINTDLITVNGVEKKLYLSHEEKYLCIMWSNLTPEDLRAYISDDSNPVNLRLAAFLKLQKYSVNGDTGLNSWLLLSPEVLLELSSKAKDYINWESGRINYKDMSSRNFIENNIKITTYCLALLAASFEHKDFAYIDVLKAVSRFSKVYLLPDYRNCAILPDSIILSYDEKMLNYYIIAHEAGHAVIRMLFTDTDGLHNRSLEEFFADTYAMFISKNLDGVSWKESFADFAVSDDEITMDSEYHLIARAFMDRFVKLSGFQVDWEKLMGIFIEMAPEISGLQNIKNDDKEKTKQEYRAKVNEIYLEIAVRYLNSTESIKGLKTSEFLNPADSGAGGFVALKALDALFEKAAYENFELPEFTQIQKKYIKAVYMLVSANVTDKESNEKLTEDIKTIMRSEDDINIDNDMLMVFSVALQRKQSAVSSLDAIVKYYAGDVLTGTYKNEINRLKTDYLETMKNFLRVSLKNDTISDMLNFVIANETASGSFTQKGGIFVKALNYLNDNITDILSQSGGSETAKYILKAFLYSVTDGAKNAGIELAGGDAGSLLPKLDALMHMAEEHTEEYHLKRELYKAVNFIIEQTVKKGKYADTELESALGAVEAVFFNTVSMPVLGSNDVLENDRILKMVFDNFSLLSGYGVKNKIENFIAGILGDKSSKVMWRQQLINSLSNKKNNFQMGEIVKSLLELENIVTVKQADEMIGLADAIANGDNRSVQELADYVKDLIKNKKVLRSDGIRAANIIIKLWDFHPEKFFSLIKNAENDAELRLFALVRLGSVLPAGESSLYDNKNKYYPYSFNPEKSTKEYYDNLINSEYGKFLDAETFKSLLEQSKEYLANIGEDGVGVAEMLNSGTDTNDLISFSVFSAALLIAYKDKDSLTYGEFHGILAILNNPVILDDYKNASVSNTGLAMSRTDERMLNIRTPAHELGHKIFTAKGWFGDRKQINAFDELYADASALSLMQYLFGVKNANAEKHLQSFKNHTIDYSNLNEEFHGIARFFMNKLIEGTKKYFPSDNVNWQQIVTEIAKKDNMDILLNLNGSGKDFKDMNNVFFSILKGYVKRIYGEDIDIRNFINYESSVMLTKERGWIKFDNDTFAAAAVAESVFDYVSSKKEGVSSSIIINVKDKLFSDPDSSKFGFKNTGYKLAGMTLWYGENNEFYIFTYQDRSKITAAARDLNIGAHRYFEGLREYMDNDTEYKNFALKYNGDVLTVVKYMKAENENLFGADFVPNVKIISGKAAGTKSVDLSAMQKLLASA